MDIQKEREAFQKFCEENFDFERHEQTYFDEQTQCYENDIGEDTESINMAWSAWQAAKAQTDQKIKLLLCDEHLKKCESPTGVFNSQYPDEEPCLICLAKEAKAQAVPDLGELQERIAGHQYYHDERGHMIVGMDDVVKEISGFDSWKAQAVPAQLDVNSILHDIDCYFDNGLSNTERTANNLLQSIYEKLSGEVKAQEPTND